MSIARDISRQSSKQTVTLTASQTAVTVTGGFSGSSIDVYLNGARIVQGQDYSLNGTSGITLTQGASAGDIIEFVIRNTSNSGFSAADTGQIVDGAVTFDKLSNSATESDNVQKRVAKAWVLFDGRGSISITNDFNVSAITDVGTGNYTVNFSNSIGGANPAVVTATRRLVNWADGGNEVVFEDSTAFSVHVIHVEASAGVDTVFSVVVFN